jgi:lysophospholipid acyltransferase
LNFFGGAVCGPSFEFYDFKLFINREKNYAAIPLAACLREVFRLFLRTIFFMALVVVALPKFPITVLAESSYG